MVLQMSSNPISRATLQGMQEANKQRYIDRIIDSVVSGVTGAANTGKTSYIYDHIQDIERYKTQSITTDDLVAAFKRKFPDCDVSYEETWVEIRPGNKVIKKGIVIDWS